MSDSHSGQAPGAAIRSTCWRAIRRRSSSCCWSIVFTRAAAELPAAAEPAERAAAGVDLGAGRHRHDLRDPDRRDRPVGRLAGGAGRAGRRLCLQGRARRPLRGRRQRGGGQPGRSSRSWRAIAVGMACGALQGLAITRLRVPPFVVTLGGLTALRGAALLLSRRRADRGLRAGLHLVGAGADRQACRCR